MYIVRDVFEKLGEQNCTRRGAKLYRDVNTGYMIKFRLGHIYIVATRYSSQIKVSTSNNKILQLLSNVFGVQLVFMPVYCKQPTG